MKDAGCFQPWEVISKRPPPLDFPWIPGDCQWSARPLGKVRLQPQQAFWHSLACYPLKEKKREGGRLEPIPPPTLAGPSCTFPDQICIPQPQGSSPPPPATHLPFPVGELQVLNIFWLIPRLRLPRQPPSLLSVLRNRQRRPQPDPCPPPRPGSPCLQRSGTARPWRTQPAQFESSPDGHPLHLEVQSRRSRSPQGRRGGREKGSATFERGGGAAAALQASSTKSTVKSKGRAVKS